MTAAFEIAAPGRILFGAGRTAEVPALVEAMGVRRPLVVCGRSTERASGLARALRDAPIFPVPGEPSIDDARRGVARCREAGCDGVLAIGGGSALDAGKAIAALAPGGADPLDHLEVVGRGLPLGAPPLPFVAIPTTAGTGSEATRNAVLGSPEHGVKASLRSPAMLPRLAVVDPDHLAGAPPAVLAAAGMDALSQLVEPLLSARAQPFTDALARDGIARSIRSLRRAVQEGAGPAEREDLALASLFGGLCLANAGLGAVHGFAAPIGAVFGAPHGAVCAALLGPCLAANARGLAARAPDHPALARAREVAALVTGRPGATVDEAAAWLDALRRDLGVPGLAAWGMTEADVPAIVEKARAASSMKANPIALEPAELARAAREAL